MQINACSFSHELPTDRKRRNVFEDDLDLAASVGLELQTLESKLGRAPQPRGGLSGVMEASEDGVNLAVATCKPHAFAPIRKMRRASGEEDERVRQGSAAGDQPRRDACPQRRHFDLGSRASRSGTKPALASTRAPVKRAIG